MFCSNQSLHKLRVTYDDESMLVLALPEPIEIALQCLQSEKQNLCMEVNGNNRAILNLTEIAQKGAVLDRT